MDAREKLWLLVPLLEDTLTTDEIKSIFIHLKQEKHITIDKKQKFKRNTTLSPVYRLVDIINDYGKGWVTPLCLLMNNLQNEYHISKIISHFLSCNVRETELVWLFEKWNELKNLDEIFDVNVNENLRANSNKVVQLLAIADYFISVNDETKVLALQSSLLESSLLEKREKEFKEQKLNSGEEQCKNTSEKKKGKERYLRDIKRFFSECISPGALFAVANHMKLQKCFSPETVTSIEIKEKFCDKMDLFLSELEKFKNKYWEWALLDAISKENLHDLWEILTYLFNEEDQVLWKLVAKYDLFIRKEIIFTEEYPEISPKRYHGIRWFQKFILGIIDLEAISKNKILKQIQNIISTSCTEDVIDKPLSSSETLAKTGEKHHGYSLRSVHPNKEIIEDLEKNEIKQPKHGHKNKQEGISEQTKDVTSPPQPPTLFFENETGGKEKLLGYTETIKERRVHFCLLLDSKNKKGQKPITIDVYINGNKHAIKLELDDKKGLYEGMVVLSGKNEMTYKYHYNTKEGEIWENLPKKGSKVNRIFHSADVDGEYVKIFDVCTFENSMHLSSDVCSMYARNLSRFLPDISSFVFGENNTEILQFKSYVKDLWLYCCQPMQLESNPHAHLPFQTNLRSNLYDFIINCKPKDNQVTKILVTLTILYLSIKHNISFVQHGRKKNLSKALILTTNDATALNALHLNICSLFEIDRGQVTEIVQKIVELLLLNEPINQMYILPLVYFMLNNGSIDRNPTVWEKSIHILKLNNVQNISSMLVGKISMFKQMIPSCPQIITFYQSLLSAADTNKLMEKDEDLKNHFTIEVYMESLLKIDNFLNIAKNDKINPWIITSIESINHETTKLDVENFCNTVWNLLKKVQSGTHINLEVAKWILSMVFSVLKFRKKDIQECDLTMILSLLNKIASQKEHNNECKNKIQFWNFVMELEIGETTKNDIWALDIKIPIKNYFLQQLDSDLEKYLENIDDWKANQEVQSCFYDAVSEFISKKSEQHGWQQSFWNFFMGKNKRVIGIFEKLFTKKWKSCNCDILRFINWPFLSHFYKIFDENLSQSSFGKSTITLMKDVKNKIQELYNHLMSGEIEFLSLQKICKNSDNFFRALEIVAEKDEDFGKKRVLIETKKKHLNEVLEHKLYLEYFLKLCQISCGSERESVFVHKLQSILAQNIDNLTWSTLYCPIEDNGYLITNPNGLQSLKEIIEYQVQENSLLLALWKRLINKPQKDIDKGINENVEENPKMDLSVHMLRIIDLVWLPLKETMLEYKTSILHGHISFGELREMFEQHATFNETSCLQMVNTVFSFRGDYNELPNNKESRIQQIFGFFQLKHKIEHSQTLRFLTKLLCLKGDYSVLDIFELEEEELFLKAIAEMPVEAKTICDQINSLSEEHIKMVKHFMNQEKLIEWLKKNMKDRGEVKVMSDLAMISAGEATLEVDKVSCFVSSVMGFSPLLFDLKEDSSFIDIIKATKAVMENKKQDTRFDKKWETTGQYLNWLDEIKNMHGSVEESSLSSAQDIICRGIFRIGCEKSISPTLDNSLLLKISDKENRTEFKEMSLEELHNLRSRLMLIAGEAKKGTEDVKRFISTLAAVENVASAYVQLKRSGCLLFNGWTATLVCLENDLNLSIQFEEGSRSIVCNNNVMNELKQLTDVLKDMYRKWNANLNKKRDVFYELNNFSIKQIIYLCKNIYLVESDKYLHDQVCTLLSCIKKDVTHADILNCWKLVNSLDNESDNTNTEIVDDLTNAKSDIDIKQDLFYKLCEDFENKDVIKAAIQDIGTDQEKVDFDNRFLWIMEHENDQSFEEKINKLAEQFDNEIGIESSTVAVIDSIVNNRSKLSVKEVVEMILMDESVLGSAPSIAVNTVCSRYIEKTEGTSLYDCISLEHLGIFLQNLSTKAQNNIRRKMPKGLNKGTPNLIVCPKGTLISYLLDLYGNEEDQPLPTTSEVLICTFSTTREDIELFLRRAVGKNKETLMFCLGAADKLSFELSELVELFLKKLESKVDSFNRNYQLVILTESSDHYISSFFDEQKVEYKINADNQSAKDYIKHQMSLKDKGYGSPATIMKEGRLVELVLSERAGLGKSLYITRLKSRVPKHCRVTTIRFLEKKVNVDNVFDMLLNSESTENNSPHFIHFDVTPSVKEGLYTFLLNLLIFGSIENSLGFVWRRNSNHVYVIEYTLNQSNAIEERFLELLPNMHCLSPLETVNNKNIPDQVYMDVINFQSDVFQRPYQYLQIYDQQNSLDEFIYTPGITKGSPDDCANILLRYFSVSNPTWSELRHFSSFLNCQLQDCENSVFCDVQLVGQDSGLNGFKNFVVKFMIEMSQEFATSSMSNCKNDEDIDAFGHHQLQKKWNESIHPYLFFNSDRISMSFINFRVDSFGVMIHPNTLLPMKSHSLMNPSLYKGLKHQRVNLNQNYDEMPRRYKLQTLIQVLGVENVRENFDPDPSYELTTDNVLKILAIQMRFRCGIPVVIMGETGCGKTRMVEFMSKLKQGHHQNSKNMIIVKVHGGTTIQKIQDHVKTAVALAKENFKRKPSVETLLFLDEANTTEAIYAIKEFVCDGTINGENMTAKGLGIVAACNPYKKHDEATIKKMEESGLGFRVRTEDTTDKLGTIPMRCLVYRVIELPPSMQPLVWDFGELNFDTEMTYIRQMVEHMELGGREKLSSNHFNLIVDVLATSQEFMRRNRSQCRFVSLRDVERCLLCFNWFCTNSVWLYNPPNNLHPLLRSILLALGMCYHVTLEERKEYREEISSCLKKHAHNLSESDISDIILSCQMKFLENIDLDEDIACNEALIENSFMMVMCAELRIPLFVIGKPGSSKSLAKTVVTHSMQGLSSKSAFFRHLKEIHVLSFQCSAVADAVGIAAVFNQCAALQSKRDLSKFVAVVVLDEIGLAEDSPKMPLKILHPLLESGVDEEDLLIEKGVNEKDSTTGSSDSFQQKDLKNKGFGKVGFVGISNWALDPAKLNRGIFVQRGSPSKNDLKKTAKGIFQSTRKEYESDVDVLVTAITDSYMEMYEKQDQEFFGLRDYYGLLKMIFYVVSKGEQNIEFYDVVNAILRNFSGGKTDCIEIFMNGLKKIWPQKSKPRQTLKKMIQDNLNSVNTLESRFLLLLTNQYAAAHLLTDLIDSTKFQFIFGSSFSQDNDYTEMCKNINRIKICMETGSTVVLLNLRDLYESLYDALNQHYLTFAGQRYVDLGLGGHRVKCRVSNEFRLIVIEDKTVVYEEFPIPLINRLEKHIFTTESVLDENQKVVAESLAIWVKEFVEITKLPFGQVKHFFLPDVFLGYSSDSVASALMSYSINSEEMHMSKVILLGTATIDAVFRLELTKLKKESLRLRQEYFNGQRHDHLFFLMKSMISLHIENPHFQQIEITSFSKILSESEKKKLASALGFDDHLIKLLTLQQFKTETDFSTKVELFFENALKPNRQQLKTSTNILIIQCAQSGLNQSLIACAKYSVKNIIQSQNLDSLSCSIIIAYVFTTERNCGATGGNAKEMISMSGPDCASVYVDELRAGINYIGPPSKLWRKQLSEILGEINICDEKVECNFTNEEFLLDMNKLIKVCIPEALLELEDEDQKNAIDRLKAIFQIINHEQIGHGFLKILSQHIGTVAHAKDKVLPDDEWAIKVACNQTVLNEAGTFTKALWLNIKKKTAKVLAKILSFIDEDSNLSLLLENLKLAETWLRLFSNPEIFSFTWYGTETTFAVFNTYSAKFPFSRRVTNFFNTHWIFSHLADANDKKGLFISRLQKTEVFKITSAENLNMKTILEGYTNDLVHLNYIGKLDHIALDLVVASLLNIFYCRRKKVRENGGTYDRNALVTMFIIFNEALPCIKLFQSLVYLNPDFLTPENIQNWKLKQDADMFILHSLYFEVVLDCISLPFNSNDQTLENYTMFANWNQKVQDVKQVADTILKNSSVEKLNIKWKSLLFVQLFLHQLIPDSIGEILFQAYLKILFPVAKRMYKGSKMKDGQNSLLFFNIIRKNISVCINEIFLKLLLNWEDSKCVQCKNKVRDPVVFQCKHFTCKHCIDIHVLTHSRNCPVCRANFQDDFIIEPTSLTPSQNEDWLTFKSNSTSFFLDYLCTVCFPGSSCNLKNVNSFVKHVLLELVVGIKRESHKESAIFDNNPTVRSFILTVLMENFSTEVETFFEEQFQTNYDYDLMTIFIKSKENSIWKCKRGVSTSCGFRKGLANTIAILTSEIESQGFVDQLNFVAYLKVGLGLVLNDIKIGDFDIDFASKLFCTNDDNSLKEYVTKLICLEIGSETFSKIEQNNLMKCLVPDVLLSSISDYSTTNVSNFASTAGINFVEISEFLVNYDYEDYAGAAKNLHDVAENSTDAYVQVMLALFDWLNSDSDFNEHQLKVYNMLINHFEENGCNLPDAKIFPTCSIQCESWNVKVLAVDTVLTILSKQHCNLIIEQLGFILENPNLLSSIFLPTIPQSGFFDVKDIMKTFIDQHHIPPKAYKCPHGHPYYVGECTNVVADNFVCPDCKEPIGGVSYGVLKPGNTAEELTEDSQKGYHLEEPNKRSSFAVSERDINKLDVCVIRFLLHACLLYNADEMERKWNFQQTAESFFGLQLEKDLKQLATALSKSMDDTYLLMHQVLKNIRRLPDDLQCLPVEVTLKTMKGRREWEKIFHDLYLKDIFENLDFKIDEARELCMTKEKDNHLHNIVYEATSEKNITNEETGVTLWNSSILWKYETHANVDHFRQKLELSSPEARSCGFLLLEILNNAYIPSIRFLIDIFRIQEAIISRYGKIIDILNEKRITVYDFYQDGQCRISQEMFDNYFSTWNKMAKKGIVADGCVPRDLLPLMDEEMTFTSSVAMLLPTKTGIGRCARHLTEYIAKQQNELIHLCRENIDNCPRFEEVNVSELTKNELICCDDEKLLPFILANSDHKVTEGAVKKQQITYKFDSVARQVLERFVFYKKLINNSTLPLYEKDTKLEDKCMKLRCNVEQVNLPAKDLAKLYYILGRASLVDICEGLETLSLAISYLAKMNCTSELRKEKLMQDFLTNDLMLSDEEATIVGAPKSTQLQHILAVFELLSWQRSVKIVLSGNDPFTDVLNTQENVDDVVSLEKILRPLDNQQVQIEINALLNLKLDLDCNGKLKDYLQEYIDEKGGKSGWCNELPDHFCLKHIPHIFQVSLDLNQ